MPTEEKAVTLHPYSRDSSSFRSRTRAFTPVLRESEPSITHDENVFVVRQLFVAKLAEATTLPSLAVYRMVESRPTAVPASSSEPEHSISWTPETPLKLRERRPDGEREEKEKKRKAVKRKGSNGFPAINGKCPPLARNDFKEKSLGRPKT